MPTVAATLALTLRGHFHLLASPLEEHAIDCDLTVDLQGVRGVFLRRTGKVRGRVRAEGLASDHALEGTLSFRGAEAGQVLVAFAFLADDGARRTLRGYVEVLPAAPLATVTELPFSLYSADDEEIGRGVLRFDARGDLRAVLRSLRLRGVA